MIRRIFIFCLLLCAIAVRGQINVDQVVRVGQNALYFEDYVLSIQYFNQAVDAKPYLAKPYFFRALAKYNLDDMRGAEADATLAIERNPFITEAYELRGVARQNLGDAKGAIADYQAVLENIPVNKEVMLNMALAQEEIGDTASAASTYSRLMKVASDYDRAHLGLARLHLTRKDTVAATAEVDRALEINKFNVGAIVMRAELFMQNPDSMPRALTMMDEAIRLDPTNAGFFINRAFMRYRTNDYYGAMSDYDYALQLNPQSPEAHYNRALLKMEVGDYDRAVDDLNEVIALKGRDYRALYNRAMVQKERGYYKEALADADAVVNAFPDLAAAYFLRFDIKQAKGDRQGAKADYDKSLELARHKVRKRNEANGIVASDMAMADNANDGSAAGSDDEEKAPQNLLDTPDEETQEAVAARFRSLLTVSSSKRSDISSDFSGQGSGGAIRGRVQNAVRYDAIEFEPLFTATFYTQPTELKPSADYLKEVDEVNRLRALRMVLQVTNHVAPIYDDDDIRRHFESVDYYTSYMATHAPRAIDFFARGMDFMTVKDYTAAIKDFGEAIRLTPDFTLAWLMRSNAEAYSAMASRDFSTDRGKVDFIAAIRRAIDDLDKVAELSPAMAIAYFNKGVLFAELDDYTSAIAAFSKAVELKPDMGEAYYNRGYSYFKLGNGQAGSSDLSRAGELGMVSAYSLLKRMSR